MYIRARAYLRHRVGATSHSRAKKTGQESERVVLNKAGGVGGQSKIAERNIPIYEFDNAVTEEKNERTYPWEDPNIF